MRALETTGGPRGHSPAKRYPLSQRQNQPERSHKVGREKCCHFAHHPIISAEGDPVKPHWRLRADVNPTVVGTGPIVPVFSGPS